jgi:hypothetical protein
MSELIERRRMLLAAAVSLTCAATLPALAQAAAPAASTAALERDGAGQTLQDLYQAALKEGGTLTVYAGGDEVSQGFGIKAGFEKQFPGMKLDLVVDLSKFHDARIEEELLRKDLKVDVAHLQTLHDFDDWAARGLLLPYKPICWEQVPAAYKDAQGRFTGLFMLTFANSYNKTLVTADTAPRDYADFLRPEFRNRIVIAYPHVRNRARVERLKSLFERLIGPVQGISPLKD